MPFHTPRYQTRGDKQTLTPDHQSHSRSLTLLEPDDDMADVQAVEEALAVFSRAPDKEQLERANRWLQDFQQSVNMTFSSCRLTSEGLTTSSYPSVLILTSPTHGRYATIYSQHPNQRLPQSCLLLKLSGRR